VWALAVFVAKPALTRRLRARKVFKEEAVGSGDERTQPE
jgi:hypothetical protein